MCLAGSLQGRRAQTNRGPGGARSGRGCGCVAGQGVVAGRLGAAAAQHGALGRRRCILSACGAGTRPGTRPPVSPPTEQRLRDRTSSCRKPSLHQGSGRPRTAQAEREEEEKEVGLCREFFAVRQNLSPDKQASKRHTWVTDSRPQLSVTLGGSAAERAGPIMRRQRHVPPALASAWGRARVHAGGWAAARRGGLALAREGKWHQGAAQIPAAVGGQTKQSRDRGLPACERGQAGRRGEHRGGATGVQRTPPPQLQAAHRTRRDGNARGLPLQGSQGQARGRGVTS